MTAEEAKKTVLALADSEVGYAEKASNAQLDDKFANAGHNNWTKYARDIDNTLIFYNGKKNGYDWCDMFVDWLFVHSFGPYVAMEMLCQPQRSAGAGCEYSAQYYQNKGRWTNDPEPGDQIFFRYGGSIGHTGIVEQVNGNQVITIEGNSADAVQRRTYAKGDSCIAGYGRPIWTAASQETYKPVDYTPADLTNKLTYGMSGAEVQEMQKQLIKAGYSCGPDGADGDFGPNTYNAVAKFQLEHNIAPTGIADEATLKAIKEAATSSSSKDEQEVTPVEPTPVTPIPTPTPTPAADDGFKIGDIVQFTGKKHYRMAMGKYGYNCRKGLARITMIYPNSKHPYHLVKLPGSTSNVCGWVDEKDIQKA